LKDFDPLVRAKSIEGLKECKDCRLITTLIDLVENDNEEAVRIKATTALGRFTLLIELNKLPQRHLDRIAQALFSVIESEGESIELRCQAVEAAAPFNLPQVKATIYQAYLSDNSKMKTSAIRAMGKNGDIQWLPILLKELKNPNPSIALEAIESCGELGEAVVIPHLVQLIQDTNGQIQSAAIKAIAEIGEEDAQEVLLKFHSHSNRIGRETAGGVWDDELD
jgi:HEAT repeat protein